MQPTQPTQFTQPMHATQPAQATLPSPARIPAEPTTPTLSATPALPDTAALPLTAGAADHTRRPRDPRRADDAHGTRDGRRADDAHRILDGDGPRDRPRVGVDVFHAASTARGGSRRLITFETPLPAIDTPYSESAASIVRFWCVTTMNCARLENERRSVRKRSMLRSSSAASTSSRM